jgi:hypothetical protein
MEYKKGNKEKKNQSCHIIRHGVHGSPGLSRDMLGWGMSWDSLESNKDYTATFRLINAAPQGG